MVWSFRCQWIANEMGLIGAIMYRVSRLKKTYFSATEHFGVNISETVQILVERQIAGEG